MVFVCENLWFYSSCARVIRLENGLTACLISDPTSAPAVDEDEAESSAEETDSEMESESEEAGSSTVEEEDDSMPKKTLNSEQKMVE